MESGKLQEVISRYFQEVSEAYILGNIESSYNMPRVGQIRRWYSCSQCKHKNLWHFERGLGIPDRRLSSAGKMV